MTITLGFWVIPVAVVFASVILAVILDNETFSNNGLLAGCFGISIIFCGVLLAIGLVIGRAFA